MFFVVLKLTIKTKQTKKNRKKVKKYVYCFRNLILHGPPMSVDKTDFGLVLCNHANFYRFEETSSYWSVKRISVFLCISLVNQRHTPCITVQ